MGAGLKGQKVAGRNVGGHKGGNGGDGERRPSDGNGRRPKAFASKDAKRTRIISA